MGLNAFGGFKPGKDYNIVDYNDTSQKGLLSNSKAGGLFNGKTAGTMVSGVNGMTSIKVNDMVQKRGSQINNVFSGLNTNLLNGQFGDMEGFNKGIFGKMKDFLFKDMNITSKEMAEGVPNWKNRYVQSATNNKLGNKNKSTIMNLFSNIDGMTETALTNSKIGTVIGGIDSRVMIGKVFKGKEVEVLEKIDMLNENVFTPLSTINWKMSYSIGNPEDREKMYNELGLSNISAFGMTPNLLDSIISGKSSMASIAKDYMNSLDHNELPDPSFDSYCKDLMNDYENGNLDVRRMAAMWDFMENNKNTMIMNGLEKIDLQSEKIIDGFGDLAHNVVDNTVAKAEDIINDTYNKANELAASFGVMLNPGLKQQMDSWMDKMGFNTKGQGKDAVAYVSEGVLYRYMIEIDKQRFKHQAFHHYWEMYDFIDTNRPTRILTMKFTAEEALQLDLKKDIFDISIQRRYGYPYTQNAYRFSLEGGAYFQPFDELVEFKAKISNRSSIPTEKEIKLAKENGKNQDFTVMVEFAIIPPEQYDETNKPGTFNEIPKGAKISEIITSAFQQCITDGGQLALTPPVNDLVLDEFPITPSSFPQVVQSLHDNFKIYEGGPNIFMDKGIYYVMNKKGPNELKLDNVDWLYKFEIRPRNTLFDKLLTMIIPSLRTVKIGLFADDIIFPSDNPEEEPVETKWNKGSVLGMKEAISHHASSLSTIVKDVNHDYLLNQPAENLPVIDFIIRIPNTFLNLIPSDDVELSYQGKTYLGTIKKWASEMHLNQRVVVLYCTSKEGKSKAYDSTPIGKLKASIDNMKAGLSTKVSQAIGNVKNKYLDGANAEGEKRVQIEADKFASAVAQYENKTGERIESLYDAQEAGLLSPNIKFHK